MDYKTRVILDLILSGGLGLIVLGTAGVFLIIIGIDISKSIESIVLATCIGICSGIVFFLGVRDFSKRSKKSDSVST